MKYTPEITDQIVKAYVADPTLECVQQLSAEYNFPVRSIIAKLSALGVYRKKTYLTKRGEVPTSKAEYIERIANLLDMNVELMESMEKVTKTVLHDLSTRIERLKE